MYNCQPKSCTLQDEEHSLQLVNWGEQKTIRSYIELVMKRWITENQQINDNSCESLNKCYFKQSDERIINLSKPHEDILQEYCVVRNVSNTVWGVMIC